MASFTETLSLIIDAKTGGAVRDVQAFGSTVKGTGDDMVATATKGGFLDKQLKNLGLTGISSGTLIATGAAVASGALIKFGADAINTRLQYASYARDFQRATGQSAEVSSRMVAVFDDLEISQEAAARGFFKLAREIGTNDEMLTKYGVQVKRTKDGALDIEETFLRVADAYEATTDQGTRAALIQEAFGRGGKELIPILEKGREGIERLFAEVPEGQIFSQQQLDQAREFELAMDDLGDAVDELEMSFAENLIPAVAAAARVLTTLIRASGDTRAALGEVSDFIGKGGALTDGLLGLGKALPVVGPALGLADAIGGLGGAFGLGGDEADKLTQALDRQAEAEKKVTQLHNEGKDGTKEFAAAQAELAAAKRAATGESEKLAAALDVENDSVQEAINLSVQRLGGVAAVAAADQAYQDALGKRTEAQLKLSQLEADGKQGTLEYVAAQEQLQDSQINIVQAFVNVQGAVQKLTEQVKNGELSYDDYMAQIDKLKRDNPELAGSIDFVTGSVRGLHGEIDAVPTEHHTQMTAAESVSGVANSAKFAIGTVPTFWHTDFTASDFVSGVANNIRNSISGAAQAALQFAGLSRQHGGPIPGAVNDAVPVMAHGGEYVLSADVVSRIKAGRPSRGAAVAGGTFGFSGGGNISVTNNVNVRGWVGTDQDIASRLGSVFSRRGGPQFAPRSIARSGRG